MNKNIADYGSKLEEFDDEAHFMVSVQIANSRRVSVFVLSKDSHPDSF